MKLALWVARRHRPFAIVEDKELIELFKELNNKVDVPSRKTVSRDVTEIFEISRKKVAAMLKVCTRFLSELANDLFCDQGISWEVASLHRWLDLAERCLFCRHHRTLGWQN
jgi:hypothetical protein